MAPVRMFLTFRRTWALPRPIFWCSYESIWTICPSSSIIAPRLRSLVEITRSSPARKSGKDSGIDYERLGRVAQDTRAVFFQHDEVLDAHAAPTWQINAGFDGKNHARSQQLIATRLRQPGRFVYFQPDAVPQAVD